MCYITNSLNFNTGVRRHRRPPRRRPSRAASARCGLLLPHVRRGHGHAAARGVDERRQLGRNRATRATSLAASPRCQAIQVRWVGTTGTDFTSDTRRRDHRLSRVRRVVAADANNRADLGGADRPIPSPTKYDAPPTFVPVPPPTPAPTFWSIDVVAADAAFWLHGETHTISWGDALDCAMRRMMRRMPETPHRAERLA